MALLSVFFFKNNGVSAQIALLRIPFALWLLFLVHHVLKLKMKPDPVLIVKSIGKSAVDLFHWQVVTGTLHRESEVGYADFLHVWIRKQDIDFGLHCEQKPESYLACIPIIDSFLQACAVKSE